VQRRAVSDPFAEAFQPVLFRLADFVVVVVEHDFSIIAFNGKDFGEDGLQAEVLPFGRRHIGLEKLPIRIDLDFDEIRRRDDFFDFTEVDTFCCSRWHFDLWLWAGTGPDSYFRSKRPRRRPRALLARAGTGVEGTRSFRSVRDCFNAFSIGQSGAAANLPPR